MMTRTAGEVPYSGALLVAAWMVFIYRGPDVSGRPLVLDDPMAEGLREAASGPEPGLAHRFPALNAIFPEEVSANAGFRGEVAAHVKRLLTEIS
jgi:fructuronate reductase